MMNSELIQNGVLLLGPGGVGGVANVLVGHPLDMLKVRQQTSPTQTRTFELLLSIGRNYGLKGLYAGVSAPLLATVPAFAVTFGSYEGSKALMNVPVGEARHSLFQVAVAGGVSGFFLGSVLGPLERIKCLLQVQGGGSFSQTLMSAYRAFGLRGVFRGTGLTLMRDVPGNAAYFVTYECVKRQLGDNSVSSTLLTLLAGGVAGMMNWVVALPIDTVKSKFQTDTAYKTYYECFRRIVQTDGPTALFRGLTPAMLRAFPANAACLLGVETTKTLLNGFMGRV